MVIESLFEFFFFESLIPMVTERFLRVLLCVYNTDGHCKVSFSCTFFIILVVIKKLFMFYFESIQLMVIIRFLWFLLCVYNTNGY